MCLSCCQAAVCGSCLDSIVKEGLWTCSVCGGSTPTYDTVTVDERRREEVEKWLLDGTTSSDLVVGDSGQGSTLPTGHTKSDGGKIAGTAAGATQGVAAASSASESGNAAVRVYSDLPEPLKVRAA